MTIVTAGGSSQRTKCPCISAFKDLVTPSIRVYHRRRPTLGLLIFPSVSPFPITIRRTARIYVLPIEPNLAEHARIFAISLDDYQLDPLTPPPSPSSPFSMAAYQSAFRDSCIPILETGPITPNACLEDLEAFMTLWDVKPRVEESSLETLSVDELITQLRQVCEDAEDRASNAQEEARQKRKETLEEVIQQIYQNGTRTTPNYPPEPVNRSTNRNNVDINSGIDTQMLNQLITVRVAEVLAAAHVTYAASTQEETNLGCNSSQNKACNYKEFRAVMHENFRGTEGAVGLTRWFEKLESQFGISNVVEGDRVKFASSRGGTFMFIRKYFPRNENKQMENEPWNLKVKGTNLTAYNQRFQELILLCPEMVPNTDRLLERYIEGLPLNIKGNVTSSKLVDLHEAIEMAQGLMYQVVQELGENSGDKQKWNGNHYNNNNPNTTSNLNPNKRPEIARVFTAGQGQDIMPKTAEPHLVSQAKEDLEAKEDKEVMLLASDVAKRDTTRTSVWTMEVKAVEVKFEATNKILRTIRGRIKETLKEITKHQPVLKEDAKHLAEYAAYVLKLW
ncbi:reverse transcriptase domain-containing protein [Tanacetum coccineum]